MSRSRRRAGTKTKVNPKHAGVQKPTKFRYPQGTKHHRRVTAPRYVKIQEVSL